MSQLDARGGSQPIAAAAPGVEGALEAVVVPDAASSARILNKLRAQEFDYYSLLLRHENLDDVCRFYCRYILALCCLGYTGDANCLVQREDLAHLDGMDELACFVAQLHRGDASGVVEFGTASGDSPGSLDSSQIQLAVRVFLEERARRIAATYKRIARSGAAELLGGEHNVAMLENYVLDPSDPAYLVRDGPQPTQSRDRNREKAVLLQVAGILQSPLPAVTKRLKRRNQRSESWSEVPGTRGP